MEKLTNNRFSHIRGFNYQPSYGSHGLEIWGEKFNISKIEKELGLGKKYFPKINTIRLWLSHDAFLKNPEGFSNNFESVLKVGGKLGLSFIPTLFNGWHSYPDFGGISPEQIAYWGKENRFSLVFLPYLEKIVGEHVNDGRILMWDLCNEPFNSTWSSEAKDAVFKWLQRIYQLSKKYSPKNRICVGSVPSIESVKMLEPTSGVITIHPYHAWNAWVKDKKEFERLLDDSVSFANKKDKPLLVTETGWGALDDKKRSETLAFELGELKRRDIGFIVHLLYHTLVADGHRPEYGPISGAGYMAFIELDGSLRPYHEVFNEY